MEEKNKFSIEHMKKKRQEVEQKLKEENITYLEWSMIRDYIEERFNYKKEKSTL